MDPFAVGYEFEIRDWRRGVRTARVVCGPDSRGRIGVRNVDTGRLSYIRLSDPRVKPAQQQHCSECGTRFEPAKYPNSLHCSTLCSCEIDRHDFNCPIHNDSGPERRGPNGDE